MRLHEGTHPETSELTELDPLGTAREALRWVTDAGVEVAGGVAWPRTRAAGMPLTDDLYSGTAGVLAALAEARLAGPADFDDYARGDAASADPRGGERERIAVCGP